MGSYFSEILSFHGLELRKVFLGNTAWRIQSFAMLQILTAGWVLFSFFFLFYFDVDESMEVQREYSLLPKDHMAS